MRADTSMSTPHRIRKIAVILCIATAFGFVAEAREASAAARSSSRSKARVSATAATRTARRHRVRRRRRVAMLRLPAITPYGIPRLHVKAAYVEDASGQVLFQKNPERVYPIASLTKLVSALVLLDTAPDWDRL